VRTALRTPRAIGLVLSAPLVPPAGVCAANTGLLGGSGVEGVARTAGFIPRDGTREEATLDRPAAGRGVRSAVRPAGGS